jgi:hypothetical protein
VRRAKYTMLAAAVFAAVFGLALGLGALAIGFLPRFLQGLTAIFVLPVGVPALFAVKGERLEEARLTDQGEGPLKMTLLIGGILLWMPAIVYFVLLQQPVELLWRGTAKAGAPDAASAGWVVAQQEPAGWEQRGRYTVTSVNKQHTTCTTVAIAAPIKPTTAQRPEQTWMCVVDRCAAAGADERIQGAMAQATGGFVIRDAATQAYCADAIKAATGHVARSAVLLDPGESVEQAMEGGRRGLAWFLGVVGLLWVLLPALRAGGEMARRYARDEA